MPLEQLRLDHDRRLVTIILSMMAVPILWFVGFDLIEAAGQGPRIDARAATELVLVGFPLAALVMIRRVASPIQYSRTVLAISFALGGIMIALILERPYGSVLLLRTPFLYLIAMYGAMPNTFKRQIAAPIVFSLALAVVRVLWFADTAVSDMASDLLVLLCVNLVGIVMVRRRRVLEREAIASWRREHIARAEAEEALQQLQKLQGIIKVCSYCRKVHSEPGVWQQIETYVREKTGVEFSHGICPTCLSEHYPDGEPIEV